MRIDVQLFLMLLLSFIGMCVGTYFGILFIPIICGLIFVIALVLYLYVLSLQHTYAMNEFNLRKDEQEQYYQIVKDNPEVLNLNRKVGFEK